MHRRQLMLAAAAAIAAGCTRQPTDKAPAAAPGATFLVAHGAWSAGWAWKKMHPLMSAAGHRLITPTYTGLGERAHLATPQVNLETHIQDLLGVIKYEQLRDFVLVAHSYGGMVATGVADRVPELIRRIVYVDAFVPRDGQSLVDIVPSETRERILGTAKDGGWLVQPQPIPDDTSPEDVQWIQQLRIPQPLHCFDMPVRLANGDTKLPRTYIYALRHPPADTFGPFAAHAKAENWDYHEIDASHSPNVTAPEKLAKLLTMNSGY
jgi:pimeloyl-ACP methyl ester carboxylesterase